MPSLFACLAIIADIYIPLLGLLAALELRRAWRVGTLFSALRPLLLGLALVFALYGLDRHWGLWARWHLDYSTHTALSLHLWVFLVRERLSIVPLHLSLFSAYGALMYWLGYHSCWDILSTLVVVGPAVAVLSFFPFRKSACDCP